MDGVLLSGRWHASKPAGKPTSALMSCPECGKVCSLSGHTINPDGTVEPSLMCPYDGCGYHDFVKLEGWRSA